MLFEIITLGAVAAGWVYQLRSKREPAEEHEEPVQNDEEDILTYLETSAPVSPLAAKLLQEGRKLKGLPEKPHQTPNRRANALAKIKNGRELADIFWPEYKAADSSAERIAVVQAWYDDGCSLAPLAQAEALEMADSAQERENLRKIFRS